MSVFPIGRMGRPDELVAAVRYLCSDDARYVTGSMLILDGGYTAQILFVARAWPERPHRDH
jgi:NAD(P)-dependent dehydrogenase (short-subunit alcohol dehydrogenase family)